MKNPSFVVVALAIVVVLIPAVLIFLNRKERGTFGTEIKVEREIQAGEIFEIKIGEKVKLGTLSVTYSSMIYPPESYQGDKEEYTYAEIVVLENEDSFRFSVADKHREQRYHDYVVKFVKREGEVVSLQIENAPLGVNVKEEEAVKKALEAATASNIQMPEAVSRNLKENVWEIEINGGPDVYFIVKINAENGDILESYRQPRS